MRGLKKALALARAEGDGDVGLGTGIRKVRPVAVDYILCGEPTIVYMRDCFHLMSWCGINVSDTFPSGAPK